MFSFFLGGEVGLRLPERQFLFMEHIEGSALQNTTLRFPHGWSCFCVNTRVLRAGSYNTSMISNRPKSWSRYAGCYTGLRGAQVRAAYETN